MTSEAPAFPNDNEDLQGFLRDLGVDLSAANMSMADNNADIPVIPGHEIYERVMGNKPPTDVEDLPVSPKLEALLATPVTTRRDVRRVRRAIAKEMRQRAAQREPGLGITPNNVDDMELGVGEALQNAIRYGGGGYHVRLGRTSLGNVVMFAENLAYEYPKNTLAPCKSGRCIQLGRVATFDNAELPREADEHARGLYLIVRSSANEARADRPVTVGLYREPVEEIPAYRKDMTPAEPPTRVIEKTIFWGEWGEPHDYMTAV